MNNSFFYHLYSRTRHALSGALFKRIVLIDSRRTDLLGKESSASALFAIIGREHYEYSRRKYPVRSRRDLARVLRLEFSEDLEEKAFWIGPLIDDEREVEIFRFNADLRRSHIRALCWVPETLVLKASVPEVGVAVVRRGDFEYFLASNGFSAIAGGLIRSPEVFALAAGIVRPSAGVDLIDHSRCLGVIPVGLRSLSFWDLVSFRSPAISGHLVRFLVPAGVISTAALLLYLSFVSFFLWASESYRTRQLEELGSEVSALSTQQRLLDKLAIERAGIANLLNGIVPAWTLWEVASAVWKARGVIHSVTMLDGRITLSCTAPVATEVFSAVEKVKGVEDVDFASAVRQGYAGQDFSLSFVREPLRGE